MSATFQKAAIQKWTASAAPTAGLKSLYAALDGFDLAPLDQQSSALSKGFLSPAECAIIYKDWYYCTSRLKINLEFFNS